MIRISDVRKSFDGNPAVDGVSFDVATGENFVLLGTSGSGKTTLLKMINRIIEPSTGTIFFNDLNILQQDKILLRRSLGYVIQDIGLFPHYTVYRNIGLIPELLEWPKDKIKDRVNYLIKLLHLEQSFLQRYPHELSGGQKQRVGIARALAAEPEAILMDEPFGALDPITRQDIRKEFRDLTELQDKTVVMVTHDVQEALEIGDRICLMDHGKVMQIGSPKEMIFKPSNSFVKNFFNQNRLALEMSVVSMKDIDETNDSNVFDGNLDEFLNSDISTDSKEAAMRSYYKWRKQNYPDAP